MKYAARLPRSRSLRAFGREKSGVAAIEFALLAPVFLVLIFAVTELAMARRARMQLTEAGLAAERYALLNGFDAAAMQTAGQNATALPVSVASESYCACVVSAALSRVACGTKCASGLTAGTYASSVTTTTYKPLFPSPWSNLLAGGNLNMSVTNVARIK